MNLLCDKAPETMNLSEKSYKINTDFRVWIKFELLLSNGIDDNTILRDVQTAIFCDDIPQMDNACVDAILWFYRCGKPPERHLTNSTGGKDIISYDYDDGYIYAAFLEQYGVDLNDISYLHWWKFRAMLQSLKDDCLIVKIMGYRSIKITSKMDTAQREYYQKLKRIYALPIPKTEQDKYNAIEDALISGQPVDNLL